MLRFACTKVTPIVRPLRITTRHAKRARTQARSNETIFTEAAASTPGQMIPGYSLGAKLTGGCAGLALGAMVYNGFNIGQNVRSVDKAAFWPQYVKERIASSYTYLFNGLLVTGCATYGVLRSPRMMALASRGGMMAMIGTIAGMIGLQVVTRSVPYENTMAKNAAFAAHAGFMGFVIAPMVAMFGDVVAQAALYTAGIVGGISALGWTAPSKEYMKMQGPFAMAAGAILIAAMASPFFNPMSGPGGALMSLVMWGGLVFASVGVFMSTQRMIDGAESHPAPSIYQQRAFDPVNASLSLYIDTIMIFQRMLFILGASKRK